ncbi:MULTISPECIES: division/cell wall cluster transcriptional repressor MraZ [Thermoanaerobacter]|jgi:MraZ protein|uniref:Transcriptional regulator MraZ n=2 Tax=Thermoanaerobacter TaxID=1754 RepID=MRAZ_THEP3|nr:MULTISPECIES: division/cell wall cluster transcriptional repressor MraZ [Thermoanaerobacter]B0K8J8.1 RecName: Full=Transcriptional regulator MraZ [Thermoanaerobacter pseudethanolicus ATCC 33223]KUJ91049.1 MAG: cell division protein MraZ [Thermoanaerobacter thermocopriae]ABY94461.1 MraZ protein [Thermoanaerobacter pseudethanolicus ATCC 33223]ADV79414.1 MraZ protein [Thermoanaerobacter brockii subsp. finnii Ako-1]MDI3500250.1 transcriptional regulator MraZ [Thermoanaerobacter sp.]MDK2814700.
MLMGQYEHTIDAKGRVIIPAKFRGELGDRFVLTKGLDNCLFVYSLEEWKNIEAKLKTLPLTKKDARAFTRFFLAGAVECEIDKQGRILIPANLREHAKIEKDVIFIGVSTRVEIWSKEVWEEYSNNTDVSFEEIAEHLDELNI